MFNTLTKATEFAASSNKDDTLISIVLSAPIISPAKFLTAPVAGNKLLWLPSSENKRDDHLWSFAGIGDAAKIELKNKVNFSKLKEKSKIIFNNVVQFNDDNTDDYPALNFFGGASFGKQGSGKSAYIKNESLNLGFGFNFWKHFENTSFAIPLFLYGTHSDEIHSGRSFLRVTDKCVNFANGSKLLLQISTLIKWLNKCSHNQAWLKCSPEKVKVKKHTQINVKTWNKLIEKALFSIEKEDFKKVVVSKCNQIIFEKDICFKNLFCKLSSGYKNCNRFVFERNSSVFFGATPERLVHVSKNGLHVKSEALAGSIKRTNNNDEKERHALLNSAKDMYEFKFVLKDICKKLNSECGSIENTGRITVRTLQNVHHLYSKVVSNPHTPVHILDLVEKIHPTPAVCGTPLKKALQWIIDNEQHTRGWYAGPVGWFNNAGEGDFAVAIRSALANKDQAFLYAGCGIVKGSVPKDEYEETNVKLSAMLTALGIS